MKLAVDDPGQTSFLPILIPTIQIPQGDGSYLVKPGKPVQWLTVKQFAVQVGLQSDAIYRAIGTDALPETFVQYVGPRKIRIMADGVEHYLAHWRSIRGIALSV